MATFKQRFSTLADILSTSWRRPKQSGRLAHQIPWMIRAQDYAGSWSPSRSPNGSASSSNGNPLADFFHSRVTGKGIWKWTHYFEAYHRHFQSFIGKDVHVLEVGVYSGGSLEMWREYFGPKCHLYGIDIREECKALEDESTKIFIGDQASHAFWANFRREVPKLDILIDDGGHQPEQQIVTLEEMLPHLRPGGVYVCEDIQGELNKFGAYVRGLSSNLDQCVQTIKPGVQKHLASVAASFQAEIGSVHFYPYMSVIEKRSHAIRELEAPCHGTEWAWPAMKKK
jgi:hypothetical protein